MYKILVTGAYGFLGKYLIDELASHKYQIVAFGRKEEELKKIKNKNVNLYVGDFCNINDIIDATKNVDYVIHAGALSTIWGKREDFINTNVKGTKNVIDACIKNNIKKIIYVSSPSIYTNNCDRFNIDENNFDANNKLNYYIESKILAEKEIQKIKKIPYVIIRPRGLFGIGDTSIIPRIINANRKIGIPLFNDGKNVVDITCVENAALALRLAVENKNANGNIYNITNDEPREFKDILEELFEKIEEKPKYFRVNLKMMYAIASIVESVYKIFHIYREPIFTKYNICTLGYSQTLNIKKAKDDLNYIPKISLSEGIKKYAKNYRENNIL